MVFERFLPTSWVERKYVEAGARFGDAFSYLYMGEPVGFEQMLREWAKWEAEYARRGFKTLSLRAFEQLGGHGKPAEGLRVARDPDSQPVLYAALFDAKYRGADLGDALAIEGGAVVDADGEVTEVYGQYTPLDITADDDRQLPRPKD